MAAASASSRGRRKRWRRLSHVGGVASRPRRAQHEAKASSTIQLGVLLVTALSYGWLFFAALTVPDLLATIITFALTAWLLYSVREKVCAAGGVACLPQCTPAPVRPAPRRSADPFTRRLCAQDKELRALGRRLRHAQRQHTPSTQAPDSAEPSARAARLEKPPSGVRSSHSAAGTPDAQGDALTAAVTGGPGSAGQRDGAEGSAGTGTAANGGRTCTMDYEGPWARYAKDGGAELARLRRGPGGCAAGSGAAGMAASTKDGRQELPVHARGAAALPRGAAPSGRASPPQQHWRDRARHGASEPHAARAERGESDSCGARPGGGSEGRHGGCEGSESRLDETDEYAPSYTSSGAGTAEPEDAESSSDELDGETDAYSYSQYTVGHASAGSPAGRFGRQRARGADEETATSASVSRGHARPRCASLGATRDSAGAAPSDAGGWCGLSGCGARRISAGDGAHTWPSAASCLAAALGAARSPFAEPSHFQLRRSAPGEARAVRRARASGGRAHRGGDEEDGLGGGSSSCSDSDAGGRGRSPVTMRAADATRRRQPPARFARIRAIHTHSESMLLLADVPLDEPIASIETRIAERARAQPPHPDWPELFELEGRVPLVGLAGAEGGGGAGVGGAPHGSSAGASVCRLLQRHETLASLGVRPNSEFVVFVIALVLAPSHTAWIAAPRAEPPPQLHLPPQPRAAAMPGQAAAAASLRGGAPPGGSGSRRAPIPTQVMR